MRFKVEALRWRKTLSELRDIFSAIPRTENVIFFEGHFFEPPYTPSSMPQALAYLPKHISKVIFDVTYSYPEEADEGWGGSISQFSAYEPTRTSCTEEIGDALKHYVASLPKSIDLVGFRFKREQVDSDRSSVFKDLVDILGKLPPQVNRLDIDLDLNREQSFDVCINRLFKAIPDTVQTLHIGALGLDGLHYIQQESVFLALSSKIRHLSLTDNRLGQLQEDSFDSFFASMPAALRLLHLGYNGLNGMNSTDLGLFLSKIPLTLETLGLCGNQLSTLNAELLENSLSMLPTTLKGLDIGENGLLLLSTDDFAKILGGLHKTVTSLRVCEKGNNPISKLQLKERFNRLPGHIELLSFSDSNLLNYSMSDFVEVLADLPETVTGLDLSHNNLGKKTTTDLKYLLANLPPQICLLKLNDNGLGCLEVSALKAVLSALPPWVWELDVNSNGLDRLPYTQMQQVLGFIPSTLRQLITGSDEFRLRNDGALVSYTGLTQAGLFKSQKRFHHQPEVAKLRLVMMQFIQSGWFPIETISRIFSYVFCHATDAELLTIRSVCEALIISSVPPLKITVQHEAQCIAAVEERIKKLMPNDNCLDLSRCGLNRLESNAGQGKVYFTFKAPL